MGKGSVENGNGILRYDLPRSINIDSLSQKQIDKIVNRINNRPMKCLGFKTPAEVFKQHYNELLPADSFVALHAWMRALAKTVWLIRYFERNFLIAPGE